MIQQQSFLKVSDNSGAKCAKCIKVIKGFRKKVSYSGDIIVVSIHELRNKFKFYSKVCKGDVYKALIIRTKSKIKKKDGSYLNFKKNCISLLTKQNKPLATRIFGPISKKEFKKEKFIKFANLSAGLI